MKIIIEINMTVSECISIMFDDSRQMRNYHTTQQQAYRHHKEIQRCEVKAMRDDLK